MTRPDPGLEPHADHDRLLVAAFAAGDLDGGEAERARHLLESCAECSRLAADLAGVARATRTLPRWSRPRDFRLTPEQVGSLRSRGLRRFLPVRLPGLAFARPLGVTLATLGLIGLLFTGVTSAPATQVLSTIGITLGPQAASAPRAPEPEGTKGVPVPGAIAAPSAAASPGSSDGRSATGGSPGPAGGSPSPAGGSPSPAASGSPATDSGQTSDYSAGGGTSNFSEAPSSGGVPLAPALSLASLLAGAGLIGAARIARRRS